MTMTELDNLYTEYRNKYLRAETPTEAVKYAGALELLDRLIEEKTAGMDLVGDDGCSEDYLDHEDMIEPDPFC